jgi:hypothetical protein
MSVTVTERATDTDATNGSTPVALFTDETAGVVFVRMDIDDMAAGDFLEVREFISAQAASTQRLMDGSPHTYRWDAGPIIELPHRSIPANCSYSVTIVRPAGADFDVVWAEIEVG